MDDPRLYYRQAKTLLSEVENIDIVFLENGFRDSYGNKSRNGEKDVDIVNVRQKFGSRRILKGRHPLAQLPYKLAEKWQGLVEIVSQFFSKYRQAIARKPDIVQASDVREITFALALRLFTGCKIIYDAHEDYFNFFYEFSGKSVTGWIKGAWFVLIEILFLRFFDVVFCTDPYLYAKYSKSRYGVKNLHLLRNFANLQLVEKSCSHQQKKHLRMVYIGTVNPYRGVIEAAEYIERFNADESTSCSWRLHFYGPPSPIVDELVSDNKITYCGSRGYPQLMQEITEYDVGLSLWLPIKKYKRNIPMKNFEYMSVGLPVLTSNFGQCQKFVEQSGAGVCINPLKYGAFKNALLKLADEQFRQQLGKNGKQFCGEKAFFQLEAKPYVDFILSNFRTSLQ